MDRQEAIKHLEEWKEVISNSHRKEVVDMAIEALQREIPKNPVVNFVSDAEARYRRKRQCL